MSGPFDENSSDFNRSRCRDSEYRIFSPQIGVLSPSENQNFAVRKSALLSEKSVKAQYIMVYPTYTHVIKALDVQPTVPKFTTQRQVRRFRKFLMAVVARIMAPDSQALIDSVLFKYRIEMRCTYQGTGAQLCEMLSAYRAPTLIDLEAISGVRVQLALVSKHSYFDNLRRLNTILEDAAWLIGRGNLASAVPDVVVARAA